MSHCLAAQNMQIAARGCVHPISPSLPYFCYLCSAAVPSLCSGSLVALPFRIETSIPWVREGKHGVTIESSASHHPSGHPLMVSWPPTLPMWPPPSCGSSRIRTLRESEPFTEPFNSGVGDGGGRDLPQTPGLQTFLYLTMLLSCGVCPCMRTRFHAHAPFRVPIVLAH